MVGIWLKKGSALKLGIALTCLYHFALLWTWRSMEKFVSLLASSASSSAPSSSSRSVQEITENISVDFMRYLPSSHCINADYLFSQPLPSFRSACFFLTWAFWSVTPAACLVSGGLNGSVASIYDPVYLTPSWMFNLHLFEFVALPRDLVLAPRTL